jgi:TRAP-type transport system periplasmic protein
MNSTSPSRPLSSTGRSTTPSKAQHKLRWVLAHEPPAVFEAASAEFVEQLRETTSGAFDVELYLGREYATAQNIPRLSRRALVEKVAQGEIEMAHCYVSSLGAFHDPLWAVELPFLFRDYEHAERFFEGTVARKLMDDMRPLGMRGLAFAYSGGYRIVPTVERELRSLDDYRGFKLRTAGNPVPEAMYASLGAKAVGADLEAIPQMVKEGEIEGCEITYVRFKAAELDKVFHTVNETSHSLFTTMTVVNEAWFNKLSDAHQAAIFDATMAACRSERRTAIGEESAMSVRCADQGLNIVRMDDAHHAELKRAAQSMYPEFVPRFGESLVEGIQGA